MPTPATEKGAEACEVAYQKLLLETFEPVLRFSAGERFFPMDVGDFMARCRLKKARRFWRDLDCTQDWHAEAKKIGGTARGNQPKPEALARALGEFNNEHYLHFVHGKEAGQTGRNPIVSFIDAKYPVIILLLSMIILIVLPAYGTFAERIRFVSFSGWDAGQIAKASLVILFVILWPLFQVDRKAYIGFVLFIASTQFFGTAFGSAIGVFGLAIWAFFFIALGVLLCWKILEERVSSRGWYTRNKEHLGAFWIVCLILVLLLILSTWDLWENQPLTYERTLFVEVVLFALLAMLGWFAIGNILRFFHERRNRKRQQQNPEDDGQNQKEEGHWLSDINDRLFEELYKPMWVIAIAAVLTGILFLKTYFGITLVTDIAAREAATPEEWKRPDWILSREGVDDMSTEEREAYVVARESINEYQIKGEFTYWYMRESVYWIRIGILAATAILWYALDPLPIWKPKVLYPYDNRQRTFAWNIRILMFILAGIVLWIGGNQWFLALAKMGSVHRLTLYYAAVILTFVFIGLVIGAKMMSAILDALSGQPDLAADYAAAKYHNIDARRRYYGRVLEAGGWTVLQYHYFYAFNDYRRIAGGMNNHEGDWEVIAVYLKHEEEENSLLAEAVREFEAQLEGREKETLKKLRPYGVAYSQHHAGTFTFWPKGDQDKPNSTDASIVKRVWRDVDGFPQATLHPLAYPALGSHANYPSPNEYPAPEHFSGAMHRIVARVNGLFAKLRGVGGIEQTVEPEIVANIEKRRTALKKQEKTLLEQLNEAPSSGYGGFRGKLLQRMESISQLRMSQQTWLQERGSRQIERQLEAVQASLADLEEFERFYQKAQKQTDHLKVDLMLEYAAGDGLRIGYQGEEVLYEDEFELALRLPSRILSKRRESTPNGKFRYADSQSKEITQWQPEVLNPEGENEGWVAFQGLWGCKALQLDEAGPSGPKWLRPDKDSTRLPVYLFSMDLKYGRDLAAGALSDGFQQAFSDQQNPLSEHLAIRPREKKRRWQFWKKRAWQIMDLRSRKIYVIKEEDRALNIYDATQGDEQKKMRLTWGPGGAQDALLWKDLLLLEMVNDTNLPVPTRGRALDCLVLDSNKTIHDVLHEHSKAHPSQ